MNIYDLPIEVDETIKFKDRAFIHENKLVCHPDLLDQVTKGMALMRASAVDFEKDVKEMISELEKENE